MSDPVLAAITSLSASVSNLQAQVATLSGQVATKADTTAVQALASTVTAEGGHVTVLTNRVAEARATTSLTSRVTSCETADLLIDAGQTVEPLRMGKVVFHSETARQIRAAQAVLREAGVGQLEVVKRPNEPREPFVVIDGQVFITKAAVESAGIDPCPYSLKVTMGDDGRFYIAGVGVGVSSVANELKLGPSLENDVRRLLREELKPGGMLHRC